MLRLQASVKKMQQGRYILFPNRIGYDHNGTVVISQEIAAISKDHNSIAMKIQINSASKAQILSDLRLFGISRESLFADSTDTVCEEITKDAQKDQRLNIKLRHCFVM